MDIPFWTLSFLRDGIGFIYEWSKVIIIFIASVSATVLPILALGAGLVVSFSRYAKSEVRPFRVTAISGAVISIIALVYLHDPHFVDPEHPYGMYRAQMEKEGWLWMFSETGRGAFINGYFVFWNNLLSMLFIDWRGALAHAENTRYNPLVLSLFPMVPYVALMIKEFGCGRLRVIVSDLLTIAVSAMLMGYLLYMAAWFVFPILGNIVAMLGIVVVLIIIFSAAAESDKESRTVYVKSDDYTG